jgi:hypothetical protein
MENRFKDMAGIATDAISQAVALVSQDMAGYMGDGDMGSLDLKSLLIAFNELQEAYEKIDSARKDMYHLLDRYSKAVLPELFEKFGFDKVAVADVHRSFYPVTRVSASIVNKEAAFEWLQQVGLGGLIQPAVNSNSLSSGIKELIELMGIEPPEEAIKVSTWRYMGSSTYRGK